MLLFFTFSYSYSQVMGEPTVRYRGKTSKDGGSAFERGNKNKSKETGADRADNRRRDRTSNKKPIKKVIKQKSPEKIKSDEAQIIVSRLKKNRIQILEDFKKVEIKRILNKESIKDLEEIKSELISLKWWRTTKRSHRLAKVASKMESLSDLVFNILEVPPGTKITATGIDITREVMEEIIKSEKIDSKEISKLISKMLFEDKIKSGSQVIQLSLAFKEFAKDLRNRQKLKGEQKKLKKEIEKQINNIDKEIENYENKINNYESLSQRKKEMISLLDNLIKKREVDIIKD